MRRSLWFWALLLGLTPPAKAQIRYLEQTVLLEKTDSCLQFIYGFRFDEARVLQLQLELLSPGHPAPVFLEALLIYWENFPLLPDNDLSTTFDGLMDSCIHRAALMLDKPGTHLEGVFFDLFGRAFKAMFWADNGKASRAVADLPEMYKRTKEGFLLVEDFPGFYFSTGLYNYYIEAYPEAHPIYKPFVAFMHKGDRNLGLIQLNRAIQESVFLRVEATLFMALIQANYENDLNTASIYAEKLHREFPRNTYYQGLITSIWLHQKRFARVRELLPILEEQSDPYSHLIHTLASAFLAEKKGGEENEAGKAYLGVIGLAESLGPIADMFNAMACMGLSRLHEARGLHQAARQWSRKAEKLTAYPFILGEL